MHSAAALRRGAAQHGRAGVEQKAKDERVMLVKSMTARLCTCTKAGSEKEETKQCHVGCAATHKRAGQSSQEQKTARMPSWDRSMRRPIEEEKEGRITKEEEWPASTWKDTDHEKREVQVAGMTGSKEHGSMWEQKPSNITSHACEGCAAMHTREGNLCMQMLMSRHSSAQCNPCLWDDIVHVGWFPHPGCETTMRTHNVTQKCAQPCGRSL